MNLETLQLTPAQQQPKLTLHFPAVFRPTHLPPCLLLSFLLTLIQFNKLFVTFCATAPKSMLWKMCAEQISASKDSKDEFQIRNTK